jgi:hypothetical protein
MTSDETQTPESATTDPSIDALGDDRPIDAELFAWPQVIPDPVAKMRAIAEGVPYCAVRETILDAPFERVWDFVSDLEHNTARIEGGVRRVEILDRAEESLRIRSHLIMGFSIEADVVLRRGWCLMNSRVGQIGMAARPEGDARTRFIHFEGSPLFGRLLRPYFHWSIGGDFRRLVALLA